MRFHLTQRAKFLLDEHKTMKHCIRYSRCPQCLAMSLEFGFLFGCLEPNDIFRIHEMSTSSRTTAGTHCSSLDGRGCHSPSPMSTIGEVNVFQSFVCLNAELEHVVTAWHASHEFKLPSKLSYPYFYCFSETIIALALILSASSTGLM